MGFPDTTITAVAKRTCEVGVNYEWAFDKYGLYFGLHRGDPALPATKPDDPFAAVPNEQFDFESWIEGGGTVKDAKGNDVSAHGSFEQNLVELRALGVHHIRIFLLCNAFNWGAPVAGSFQPPPYLHPRFTQHLNDMFVACQRQDVAVIPSLLDFGICQPSLGAARRSGVIPPGTLRDTFFNQVLEPFLDVSAGFDDGTVLAWEIMNEPYWLSNSVFPHGSGNLLPFKPFTNKEFNASALDPKVVDDFLTAAIQRVERRNFSFIGTTVGHRFFSELDDRPTGSLPQFHYYPKRLGPFTIYDERVLPRTKDLDFARPILGEFASGAGESDPWFELGGRDGPTARERVFARLSRADALGYTLAYVWPDLRTGTPTATNKDPLKLSAEAQAGIKDYVLGKP